MVGAQYIKGLRQWGRPDLNRGPSPCKGDVIARLDHGPNRHPG